jgi:hypothetical protein
MVKLIGILVMSAQLLVAIESQSLQSERGFDNSSHGVELLIDYLEQAVLPAPNGIFILVGWSDESASHEFIIEKLHELDIKYSLVSPDEIREANRDLRTPSGASVIDAFKARRNRILRRQ